MQSGRISIGNTSQDQQDLQCAVAGRCSRSNTESRLVSSPNALPMPWVPAEEVVAREPPSKTEAEEVFRLLKLKKHRSRFLTDENFPADAIALLQEMRLTVHTASDAGLVGHSDESYTAYALRHRLVLITCDRDYLNRRKFPLIGCPAIAVFDFGYGTTSEKRDALRCLVGVAKAPDFYDKWCKLDAKPKGWTEETRHLNGTISRERCRVHHGRIEYWRDEW
jgi:predicted nuclease of predicted toxin-antitoxin system